MKHHLRQIGRIVLGLALILIGLAGLLLPILPGWAFLIPGALLLADYFPPLRRLVNWSERKLHDDIWPWCGRRWPRAHAWATDWARRIHAEAQPYVDRFVK